MDYNSTNTTTTPNPPSSCNFSVNPWCGELMTRQYFEIFFLILIVILGVIGNLLVILSIVFTGKTLKHGNIFIINLAVADFLATGIYTPTVIINVFALGPGLPDPACQAFGYIIIAACSSSMWNLAFIALNRYWAVARRSIYLKVFKRRNIYFMVVFIWVWSNIIIFPQLAGWGKLQYDYKAMVCAYDDINYPGYNTLLITGAILVPLVSTVYCYIRLFVYVHKKGKKLESAANRIRRSSVNATMEMNRKRMNRQISLVKTLATAVVMFVVFWSPYAICVLFLRENVDPLTKKTCTWFGLCNSTINFIIYGVLNKGFRDGYIKLLSLLFCRKICSSPDTVSNSNSFVSHQS